MNAMTPVRVLLSIGRHPLSGAARPADLDARAVEMALAVTAIGLHVGEPDPALEEYLAIGLKRIDCLVVPSEADVVAALASVLRQDAADLVFCGPQSESGLRSGMLPYRLGAVLDWPVIAGVVAYSRSAGELHVTQATGVRRRIRLTVNGPAILVVGPDAPAARPGSLRSRRSGLLCRIAAPQTLPPALPLPFQPYRKRAYPEWIPTPDAASEKERIRAIRDAEAAANSRLLAALSPQDAAQVILSYLRENRILAPLSPKEPKDEKTS